MGRVDYFERKLDNKRRLTIPTELRAELSKGVVITRGFGKYLHLYPKIVWDEQVEPRLSGDLLDSRIADLNIRFRTGKVEAELDKKQGRVMLEQDLLDYAGIAKEVIAVSAGLYWRLMSPEQAEAVTSSLTI
jgi:MraZ protein